MSYNKEQRDLLAAEYVLGSLSSRARRRMERKLRHDPALVELVRLWEGLLSPLDATTAPVSPPESVWVGVNERINKLQRISSRQRARPFRRMVLWQTSFAVAFCALLVAGLMTFGLYQQQQNFSADYSFVLNDMAEAQPCWLVRADLGRAELEVIRIMNSGPLPDDQEMELWLLPADGSAPISIGMVAERDEQMLAINDKFGLMNSKALAISLEPKGGSPTGQPTGPVVYVGNPSRIQG